MQAFLSYMLEVSILFSLLYSLYILIVNRQTVFQLNRWLLLLIYPLSFVIPLISIDVFPVTIEAIKNSVAPTSVPIITEFPEIIESQWSVYNYLGIIYLMGFTLFSVLFLTNLYNIYLLIKKSEKQEIGNLTVIISNKTKSPSSFFHYIFNSPKSTLDDIILEHEKIHIRQYHTLDILVSEVIKIILWFHPFSWSMTKMMKLNHEYICDEVAIQTTDAHTYATTLSSYFTNHREQLLLNSFAHQLKKRIIMLSKNQANKSSLIPYFSMIPLLAIIFGCFTFDNYYVPVDSENKVQDTLIPVIIHDTIFTYNTTTGKEEIKIIHIPVIEKMLIDTISTFDSGTYEETVEIVQTKIQLVEMIDTIITFDNDTYEETVQIVKTDVPLAEYQKEIESRKQSEKPFVNPNSDNCIILQMGNKAIPITKGNNNISISEKLLKNQLKQELQLLSISDCIDIDNYAFTISIENNYKVRLSNLTKKIVGMDFDKIKVGTKIYIRDIVINDDTKRRLGPITITVI